MIAIVTMLASEIGLNLAMNALNMVLSIAITIALFYVGGKTKKIDKLEDQLGSSIAAQIDHRISGVREREEACRSHLTQQIDDVREDMRRGSDRFAVIEKEATQMRVELLKTLGDVRENMVTKQDLRELRVDIKK